jgi:signal transduction histidine kinase/ActR/RegA family two-component response regulator
MSASATADDATQKLFHGLVGSLPHHFVLLDRKGVILAVNARWKNFAEANGGDPGAVGVGANYLEVCRVAAEGGDEIARRAVEGLEALISRRSDLYTMEYPCDSPDRPRWFLMHAVRSGLTTGEIIISHTDITAQKRAEESLKEADRRKDEFLATLAHELRNPLAPIRNGLEVLKKREKEDDQTRRIYEMMDRQVRHLVRLVDDLLEVSRIHTGKIRLETRPLDLAKKMDDAIAATRHIVDARGLELRVVYPGSPLLLEGDPVRLAQVFTNLLGNAAKFTDRGGRVEFTAERRDQEAVVTVADTGVGIPKAMLPHVFDLFFQAGDPSDCARGGLGIGLALVRDLVRLHGGDVEAQSDGEGLGSRFIVRLPLSPAAIADKSVGPERDRPATRPERRVIVVDDNPDVALSLAMLLEISGATVRTACSGAEAIQALGAFKPDLVLLDLGMSQMDGFETARRIRELPGGSDVTLVALTGWSGDEIERRTRDAGFDGHLTKPADAGKIEEILDGLRSGA